MVQGNEGGAMTFGVTLALAWCFTCQWDRDTLNHLEAYPNPRPHRGLWSHFVEHYPHDFLWKWANLPQRVRLLLIITIPAFIIGVALTVYSYLPEGN